MNTFTKLERESIESAEVSDTAVVSRMFTKLNPASIEAINYAFNLQGLGELNLTYMLSRMFIDNPSNKERVGIIIDAMREMVIDKNIDQKEQADIIAKNVVQCVRAYGK